MTKVTFHWLMSTLFIYAPNITALKQLGLSRAREYDADVEDVDLTKDLYSLVTALQKLEKLHAWLLQKSYYLDVSFPSLHY